MIDPPTFETPTTKVWFLETGPETDGDRHVQRVEYAPASKFPPKHYHPSQDERFEVESGQILVVVAGKKRILSAGESIDIPRKTTHKMRNPSKDEPATVLWITEPALRTTEFHMAAAGLAGGSSILDRAVFAHEFRDVFRLAGLQGLLLPALAKLGSALGRRPPDVG